MTDEFNPEAFRRKPDRYEITWRGITIEILYKPPFARFYVEHPIGTLQVKSIQPSKARLPITKTGCVSRVVQGVDIEAQGGPVAYVLAWLEFETAKSAKWRKPPPTLL
jgi:hypothetical protein